MSTWLITGCSSGLGRALAEAVIEAGHHAVVTARDVAKVADLAGGAPERVLAAALDVTDPHRSPRSWARPTTGSATSTFW